MRLFALAPLLLVLSTSVASAATWEPPATISPIAGARSNINQTPLPSREDAILERQDASGDVVLAWTRDDYDPMGTDKLHVEIAFKPAGKPWLPQEEVGAGSSSLEGLAMDGTGAVTVAYGSSDVPIPGQLSVRSRAPNGVWSPVALFGTPDSPADGATVSGLVADDAGDVLLVYRDGDPTHVATPLLSALRPAGGAWGPPAAVDTAPPASGLGSVGLGMAANGVATLLEKRTTPAGDASLVAQRFTAAGGWQAPTPIFALPASQLDPGSLAVSQDGDATFAAIFPDGNLVTASRSANAPGWTPMASLGVPPSGQYCRPLQLAVDSAGEAIIACPGSSLDTTYGATYVWMRAVDGTWGPIQIVATNNQRYATAQLAMADDGHALLNVWIDPKAPDPAVTSELLERWPGKPWAPTAQPFAASPPVAPGQFQPAGTVYSGPGRGITALQSIGAVVGGYNTFGLSATVMTQPAAVVPKRPATAHRAVRLVGTRVCTSVGHPCRTTRSAHLSIGGAPARGSLRLTISHLRHGAWRFVQSVRVHLRGGRTTVRLPIGSVRVSSVSLHDTRRHAWAAYLLVH
jgi:hypothetical protein